MFMCLYLRIVVKFAQCNRFSSVPFECVRRVWESAVFCCFFVFYFLSPTGVLEAGRDLTRDRQRPRSTFFRGSLYSLGFGFNGRLK